MLDWLIAGPNVELMGCRLVNFFQWVYRQNLYLGLDIANYIQRRYQNQIKNVVMLMKYNFLTLGYDCSPANALRELKLREFALPFDWVQSSIHSLEKCFEDDFKNYHANLKFNPSHKRLVDEYGFEFPHDYPLDDMSPENTHNTEVYIPEEDGKTITPNWRKYHPAIREKYLRRIERFRQILNDDKPIILLCRWRHENVLRLLELFEKHYSCSDVFALNASECELQTDRIRNIHTERNGIWNETEIWKEAVNRFFLMEIT